MYHLLYKIGFVLNGIGVIASFGVLMLSESVKVTNSFGKTIPGSMAGLVPWLRGGARERYAHSFVFGWGGKVSLALIFVGLLLQTPYTFTS